MFLKRSLFAIFIFTFTILNLHSEIFQFKYQEGQTYRILSTTEEDVFVNGIKSHHSKIINRISVETLKEFNDGSGELYGRFMTTETASTSDAPIDTDYINTWGTEYESQFIRNKKGEYTIDPSYFMPVVRNVPNFPEKDIKIGESWEGKGLEAHDLSFLFGIEKPLIQPFTAQYKYDGVIKENGTKLHLITVEYQLSFSNPLKKASVENYPVYNMIYSKQHIYWNNEIGEIARYNETFRILIETNKGDTLEFSGTAQASVQGIEKDGTKEKAQKIQNQLEALGIENTTVQATDRGIKISLEKIQFKANSAVLLDTEKEKLDKIAPILQSMNSHDLLITGHCAKWGSEESQKNISEMRATSVAHYLLSQKIKNPHEVYTKGMGSTEPVAPNTTEENMARNRRVEIIILDK